MRATIIFLSALLVIALLTGMTNEKKDKQYDVTTYTVQKGDTLDGVYYEYNVDMPLEKWRYEVNKLNGKEQSGLMVGEELKIYVEREDKQ